jgi:hypothetical protein
MHRQKTLGKGLMVLQKGHDNSVAFVTTLFDRVRARPDYRDEFVWLCFGPSKAETD